MLTAVQQERYSRHLLLDPLSGAGQERLLLGTAVVSLPAEAAQAARWAVRALATCGVGTLVLHGPWADEAAAEVSRLNNTVRTLVDGPFQGSHALVCIELFDPVQGVAAGAQDGGGQHRILLDPVFAGDPSSAAAVGAQAAIEAVKLLAGVGRQAALPLTGGP